METLGGPCPGPTLIVIFQNLFIISISIITKEYGYLYIVRLLISINLTLHILNIIINRFKFQSLRLITL